MSYMRASFLMRKTRYVKTYVKWTELFGNREKATILNRGKSPYTKGVIVVDIVDKAPVSYTHLDVYKRQAMYCAICAPMTTKRCVR